MWRYVTKRILLSLPTLAIILILAFMLSRMVPGDQAYSLVTLQGISLENVHAEREYEKIYRQLGMEKPNFYCSIVPDFYPQNINEIVSAAERNEAANWLKQKCRYSDILVFQKAKKQLFSKTEAIEKDTGAVHIVPQLLSNIQSLRYASLIADIQNYLDNFSNDADELQIPEMGQMNVAAQNMINNCATYYFPKFVWNGANCQFHAWVANLLKGNAGISIKDASSVSSKIGHALKWTIVLLILQLFFVFTISLASGMYSGYKLGGIFDKLTTVVWMILYAIPVFWLASLLIVYFTSDRYAAWMDIFPAPGIWVGRDGEGVLSQIVHNADQLILPVICLVANDIAFLSRVIRNNIRKEKSNLYALMAKAKGLNNWQVITRHVMPNAMIPLTTVLVGSIPAGLSGTLIIEVIFNIPGMGRLMFDSIAYADWNVVFGILIVISICTMFFLLVGDVVYSWINPKIELE